jgi:hypothetical protein
MGEKIQYFQIIIKNAIRLQSGSYDMTHITRLWYILTGSLKFNENLFMGLEFLKTCNGTVKNEGFWRVIFVF